MMNNYNNYAPMGAQQQYGYNPAFGGTRYGQAPQIRFSQPLTTEKAKLLRGNSANNLIPVGYKTVIDMYS